MPVESLLAIVAAMSLVILPLVLLLRHRNVSSHSAPSRDNSRRELIKLTGVLGIILTGLAIRLAYVAVVRARSTSERSGSGDDGEILSNPRAISDALDRRRGRIVDRNGVILAQSSQDGDVWRRDYIAPEAAHLLGYFSPLRYGTAGIEQARNKELSGSTPLTLKESLAAGLLSRSPAGHDINLTIDSDLQRLASTLLAETTGSIVLIEPRTGRILAMASSPAYDPNELTAVQEDDIEGVNSAWSELADDGERPLLLRATSGLYPPGSTFKVLIAAAAIDSGEVEPATTFVDSGSLNVDGRIIPEFNRPDESKEIWTVAEGLAYSLNVVFAQIGLQLGSDRVADYAQRFGIGDSIPFELPTAAGQVSSTLDNLDRPSALADTSFGQGELLVSPLHMALVMCAMVNRGRIPAPILVSSVRGSDGSALDRPEEAVWRTPIRPESADTVLEMLYGSVGFGYASRAAIAGLNVAAKTGTAESGREAPHGWFIGSAGVAEPSVAVSVCLDYGGEGGGLALDIGRQLLDAAVSR